MGRLWRLEVENFKSYAGNQVVDFAAIPFAAVIGPNGSGLDAFRAPLPATGFTPAPHRAGKSNLMDAISFVLGVQSRHLRSQKMQDLVFRTPGSHSARRAHVKLVYRLDEAEAEEKVSVCEREKIGLCMNSHLVLCVRATRKWCSCVSSHRLAQAFV